MIRREVSSNGLVVYQSSLIEDVFGGEVLHGFSTRVGGMSEAGENGEDYVGLDLGVESDLRLVGGNWRKLRKGMEMQRMVRREVRQVHGGDVKVWRSGEKLVKLSESPKADGMVSGNTGEMLAIRTADCGAVLLAGRDVEGMLIVGALHAGWRGVVEGVGVGVVGHTVAAMREVGCEIGGLVGVVGPCIGVGAFEVGEEVADAFEVVGLDEYVMRREKWAKPHVDLKGAIVRQLVDAGVSCDRIDVCDVCTFENHDEFYSYRRSVGRDGLGGCGRMAAVIGVVDRDLV